MKITVLFLMLLSVISCANENAKIRYQTSQSTPTLEIPPDLTHIDDSENRAVPNSPIGTRAVIGRFKDTGPLLDKVLPKITGVTLQGSGDYHWLEVDAPSTEVYDRLKTFWAEEGFTLDQDEPLIGVMKTEWLENKAGLLFASDSFFLRMLSSLSSTDTKDQYRTRVERNELNNKTNVYVTQSGQEFFLADTTGVAGGGDSGWQSRPVDPELEVEMLSRIMLFFGLQDDAVKIQLAKIGKFPKRARLAKNDNENSMSLIVKESFDRTWNRVIINLNRAGIDFEEKDKDAGVIRLKQTVSKKDTKEKGFLSNLFSANDKESEQKTIQLNISFEETSSQATEITMFTNDDLDDNSEPAIAMLQYLYERLK